MTLAAGVGSGDRLLILSVSEGPPAPLQEHLVPGWSQPVT